MFSLSSISSFPAAAWPSECTMGHDANLGGPFSGLYCIGEAKTPPEGSLFSGEFPADGGGGRGPVSSHPTSEESSTKKRKLSHNAYERDRRKKINGLYSTLRSLLPETEHHKKLSIPCTVSRFLKYIPELQRHIEGLARRKEEIIARLSRKGDVESLLVDGGGGVHPIVSVADVGDREIATQIIGSSRGGTTRRQLISAVLEYLEGEGLGLVSASFLAMDENRELYSLHLQVKGSSPSADPGKLSRNLTHVLSQKHL